MEISPCTLKEAKERWNTWTRHVVSDWVLKLAKERGKQWVITHDPFGVEYHTLKIDWLEFVFYKENGHVHARDTRYPLFERAAHV